jgi:Tfp pilus assembly protein PilZ
VNSMPISQPRFYAYPSRRPPVERRSDPRYFLRLAINLQGDNNFYLGLTSDIRVGGGVFVATRTLLPIGTPVLVAFTFPGSRGEVCIPGRVSWTRGVDATAREGDFFGFAQDGVKAGMGIELDGLDAMTARRIHAFMWHRNADFFA